MTNLIQKIDKILNWLKDNPIETLLTTGLVGLIATTALKENVHFIPFGTIEFSSPIKNQHIWGIWPITVVYGKSDAKINTYGWLVGANIVEDNSSLMNIGAYGLLFLGENYIGNNSSVKDIQTYGLFIGANKIGNSSSIKNMGAYSLFGGINRIEDKTKIDGKIISIGAISETPTGTDFAIRTNKFKDYVHGVK